MDVGTSEWTKSTSKHPKKTIKITNTETLDNITNIETLVKSINTGILVNSLKKHTFKDPGHNQSHT